MARKHTVNCVQGIKALGHSNPYATTLDELNNYGATAQMVFRLRTRCYTVKQVAKIIHKRDRYVTWLLRETFNQHLGVAQIKYMRSKGLSIKAIAKELKISDRIVAKVVRAHFRKNKVAK